MCACYLHACKVFKMFAFLSKFPNLANFDLKLLYIRTVRLVEWHEIISMYTAQLVKHPVRLVR